MKEEIKPFKLSENPFVTGQPVLREDFFGRADTVENVFNFLQNKTEYNCLIYGQRRIGKTSLLRHLEMRINDNTDLLQAVYINLQGLSDMTLEEIIPQLAKKISSVFNAEQLDLTDVDSFYKEFLPRICRISGQKTLVILFDEFDSLTNSDFIDDIEFTQRAKNSFIGFIYKCIDHAQNINLPVKFIIAVGRNYKDLQQDRFDQVLRFGPKYEISYFNYNTVKELLKRSDNFVPFTKQAAEYLNRLCAGHPLFTQCLASVAFVHAEKSGLAQVTDEIIKKKFIETVKSYGTNVYWIWNSLTHEQMIVLYIMAGISEEKDKKINTASIERKAEELGLEPALIRLDQVLQQLDNAKFIKPHCDYYLFYAEFFRQWIVLEVSLKEVKNLLPKINEDVQINLSTCLYYFRKADYEKALEFALNLLKFVHGHPKGLLIAAKCYNQSGDVDLAYDYFKQAYRFHQEEEPDEFVEVIEQKIAKAWDANEDVDEFLEEIWKIDESRYGDLRVLREIEKQLDVKLKKTGEINWYECCYCVNKNNRITGLSLFNCNIIDVDHISSFIKNLIDLNGLYLGNNQLSNISSLKDSTNLTELLLSDNQINDVSNLKYLTNLTKLYLAKNQISNILAIEHLKNLEVLSLWQNQVSDISPLKNLTKLTTLALRNNPLRNLPFWITDYNMEIKWEENEWKDGFIYLYDNPLQSPPIEIVKQGKEAIKDYFKSLQKETVNLNEVKILMTGQGMAGKTSLLKQIQGLEFDKNESQTHGINVVDLQAREIKGFESFRKKDCCFHFWDFGGQEIMHATHSFFLTQRSLYILVLDSRTDSKKYYWLKHIQKYGADSPVIVVINKIDENPSYNIQQNQINKDFPQINNRFVRISCKTGEGLDQFIKLLAHTIPQTSFFGAKISVIWNNVKTDLVRETKQNKYISRDQFIDICSNNNLEYPNERQTLLQFLNDLGIVLHFKNIDLKNIYVLDPNWFTIGVYRIINSAKIKHGILKEDDLDYILNKEKIKKQEYEPAKDKKFEYHGNEQTYILNIMIKFELCYLYDKDNRLYIIPNLLPQELTPEPELPQTSDLLRFIFEYDYMPAAIMPRLMLALKDYIIKKQQWKFGMLLKKEDCKAKITTKEDGNKIKIKIQEEKLRKREFLTIIRHEISKINKSFANLEVKELLPLPGYKDYYVEYSELSGYEKAGKQEYFSGKLGQSFSVPEILDTVITRAQREKEYVNVREDYVRIKHEPHPEKKKLSKEITGAMIAAAGAIIAAIIAIVF